MKIAVGSTNPVKIEAVKKAFHKVWPDKKWVVVGIEINSKVSDQPKSDVESILGATNRAKGAQKIAKSDFAVGIEAGIQEISGKWFTSGWVAIINKKGAIGFGSSIRMHLSPKIMSEIKKGKELGHIDDEIFKSQNTKHSLGHFGLMTKGALPRASAYEQAVISALARFISPKHFK